MRLITAVVTPNRTSRIWRILHLFDVDGMTVTPLHAYGRHRCRIELVASDADTPDLFRVLARACAPDDLVYVTGLDAFFSVQTGQYGPDAL